VADGYVVGVNLTIEVQVKTPLEKFGIRRRHTSGGTVSAGAFSAFCKIVLRATRGVFRVGMSVTANQPLNYRSTNSCPSIRIAVVSGDAVVSATVRR